MVKRSTTETLLGAGFAGAQSLIQHVLDCKLLFKCYQLTMTYTILETSEYALEMIYLQKSGQPTALFIQKMNVSSAYSNMIYILMCSTAIIKVLIVNKLILFQLY